MTPERRRQVEELYRAALERLAPERLGWIAERCAGETPFGAIGKDVRAAKSALIDRLSRARGTLTVVSDPEARTPRYTQL